VIGRVSRKTGQGSRYNRPYRGYQELEVKENQEVKEGNEVKEVEEVKEVAELLDYRT